MYLKCLFISFVLFFLSACEHNTVHINNPEPSMLDIARGSTVAFVKKDSNSNSISSYCTGVWINKDTILTAFHCIEDIDDKKISQLLTFLIPDSTLQSSQLIGCKALYTMEKDYNILGENPKYVYNAIIIAIDPEHDLTLLQTKGEIYPEHNWLRIANYTSHVGDKVYIIGHPMEYNYTVMDGIISAVRETFPFDHRPNHWRVDGPFLQIFSGIYHGNSGGPVINQNNEIVGIVSFTIHVPNQGFAIASPSIKHFVIKSNYDDSIK